MNIKNILFVSHKKSQCGVYEFGKNISDVLIKSKRYNFIRVECDSMAGLYKSIEKYNPRAIIYNYHPSVMPRLTKDVFPIPHLLYKSNIFNLNIPQIGIIHEVTQNIVDKATKKKKQYMFLFKRKFIYTLFDYYIAPDSTLMMNNINVFQTGRLIPNYDNKMAISEEPIIGSLGFGTPGKGFEEVVRHVQKEFDVATIRMNIPFATFGDQLGENAKKIAMNCLSIIKNPNITLKITHDFLTKKEMLDFLAKNSINVFLYQTPPGSARGLSSVIENALAVKRPICISKSSMFRHIANTKPSICIEDNTIKNIMQNGVSPLEQYHKIWSEEAIIHEYEKIIDGIL